MPTYKNLDYIKIVRPLPATVNRDIYSIPFIEKDHIDISNLNNGKWLVNLKNASPKDKNACRKIVHAFCYDDVLRRFFNSPYHLLKNVGPYYAVASFDFSMSPQMDFKQILSATYDNRWIGAFLQSYGKKIAPTVGWVRREYYDITFAGLRDGSTFFISSLGNNNLHSYRTFIEGYYELRCRFPSSQIICVGDRVDGMDDDICFIPYEDSFGSWDRHRDYWQPKLFNWDCSPAFGGDKNVI